MPAPLSRILLLCTDRETQLAVSQAAAFVPEVGSRLIVCQDQAELARRLEEHGPLVAIVDLEPKPLAVLANLEPLTRRFNHTRFVVLCRELKNEYLLEAMRSGVRHCLARSTVAADLPAVLRRLLQDNSEVLSSGRMVTVLSSRGGCGATTVAINLAQESSLATGRPTLLVDLDRHYGSMGAYLGLTAKYGLRDLVTHGSTIDEHLVRSSAAHYSEDLHVLLGPASIESTANLDLSLDRLGPTLAACRQAYPLTVVDAPRVPIDVAAELALASQMTLVVFELSVVDIRGASALLSALGDRRVARDSIVAVANRYRRKNPMLSLEDAQKALSGWNVLPVSNDYLNALKSINLGQPLSEAAPRSDLRRDIQGLAARLDGSENAASRKKAGAR